MANELTLGVNFNYRNGLAQIANNLSKQVDVSATPLLDQVKNIATSETTVSLSGVTSGYALVVNLDATNYVQLGTATGVYWAKLKALQFALVPLNAPGTLYLLANTAACDVQVIVLSA